ncbi:MAG: ABC-2 family transporter protein [Acidimicrobiia bacterium]|nr:ABC-2 family transporter protein [Acidimicrobiia bacterium]
MAPAGPSTPTRIRVAVAPYLAVSTRAFRQFATYRGATFAGVVTNTMFGFIYAFVFRAVHDEVGMVGRFTATDTTTFVFAAQGFLLMTGAFGDRDISDRIRTGDIAADLYRPVDFQLWWLAHDHGKAAFHALARGIPPFAIGLVVLGLPFPGSPAAWLAFIPATVLGVTIAFAIRFLANLSGFWLLDVRGVVALVGIVQLLLAGHIVPLYFMPDRIQAIVRATPFAGITAHPVEILLGARWGGELLAIYAGQIAWLLILLGAGRALLGRARRNLVIQGG